MKMNSKNSYKEIEDFFEAPPTSRQKAWGLVNKFYHLMLTNMEEKGISRTQLAKKLNRSKSSISRLFNKTPNISVFKMVEIADAIGIELDIVDLEKQKNMEQQRVKESKVVVIYKSEIPEDPLDAASEQFLAKNDELIHLYIKNRINYEQRYDC